VVPQIVLLDYRRPDWEQAAPFFYTSHMAKNGAAFLVALTGVVIYQLLRWLGLGRVALLATVIAALGSSLWATASQALWQHGPAALALSLTLALLLPPGAGRSRLFLAGLAAALVAAARPQNIVLVLPIAAWVAWRYRRDALWFLPAPIALGAAVVGINYWYFGTAGGGYNEIEPLALTRTTSPATDDRRVRGPPNAARSEPRALRIQPWTALALASLPATHRRIAQWPLLRVALWSLVPFFLFLSMFAAWWGGWSFGPRYCTDVIPLFAILPASRSTGHCGAAGRCSPPCSSPVRSRSASRSSGPSTSRARGTRSRPTSTARTSGCGTGGTPS
jgi:hypothetical protein